MTLPIARHYKETIRVKQGEPELAYTLYHVCEVTELVELAAWCRRQPHILVDTETSGIDVFTNHLATIQIGYPLGEEPAAFVVDFRKFTPEDLLPLKQVLEDPKIAKLGQNIKFELLYLQHRAGIRMQNVKDTFVTEFLLRAGLFPPKKKSSADAGEDTAGFSECSMESLAARYLGIPIDKGFDVRTSFYTTAPGEYTMRQLRYAAGDVIYPEFIFHEQMQEIHARKLSGVLDVEFRFTPIAAEIQLKGIKLDTAKWQALWQEAEAKRQETEAKLHALLFNKNQQELFPSGDQTMLYPRNRTKARKLNFDSPEQLKWAIKQYCNNIGWKRQIVTSKAELNKLKLKYGASWIQQKYETTETKDSWQEFLAKELDDFPDWLLPEGQFTILVSTDKDVLKLAQVQQELPGDIVELLLAYGKASIASTTFGTQFIAKHVYEHDGRVHPQVNQNMTSTGRTSMTPNMQNIPNDSRYRACFIPGKGYKFVIADYSQQEPRITAQECLDPVYLKTFLNDEDIYVNGCEALLGYRPDVNSPDAAFAAKSKRDRQLVKQIFLAMAYRMGARKLHRKLLLAFADDILAGKMEPPTYEEVKGLHAKFLGTFKQLVDYQNFCSDSANPSGTTRPKLWDRYLKGYVTWASSRCGRKRFFPPSAKNTYTEAANSPIQGCAATMSKAAAILIDAHIRANNIDAWPVDLVHDELVYECREDQAQEFALAVQRLMEKAGKFYLPDVPIKADFPKHSNGVVDYWTKEAA